MTRGRREPPIAPGIYPDPLGFEARVFVKGQQYAKRFPSHHPIALMQAWQAEERAYRLHCWADDAATIEIVRGTLPGDVQHYLQRRIGRPSYKADRSHLAAWVRAFGAQPRHGLTRHRIETQIGSWLAAGKSPKTIRHRVRVLKELWHALDGRHARTPLDAIRLPRVPKTIPVPVDDETILRVGVSLRDGLTRQQRCGRSSSHATIHRAKPLKTYARFLVYALSGQRPSQIGRALPEHLDLERHIWHVTSGKGGEPVPFPLSEQLELAFGIFDVVDAWGSFNTRSFSLTLRRHGWPPAVRPYRLRHSFAIGQLLAGTDLGDLQGLLGHTNPNTTRRYAPVLLSRLKSAIERRTLTLVAKA